MLASAWVLLHCEQAVDVSCTRVSLAEQLATGPKLTGLIELGRHGAKARVSGYVVDL